MWCKIIVLVKTRKYDNTPVLKTLNRTASILTLARVVMDEKILIVSAHNIIVLRTVISRGKDTYFKSTHQRFGADFSISGFLLSYSHPSIKRLLFRVSKLTHSAENATYEDHEGQHISTSARRNIALNEAIVHVTEDGVEVRTSGCLRPTPFTDYIARFFLHLPHHGKRGAIDYISIVEVAHYAEKRKVKGVRCAVLTQIFIEGEPVCEEHGITFTGIVERSLERLCFGRGCLLCLAAVRTVCVGECVGKFRDGGREILRSIGIEV